MTRAELKRQAKDTLKGRWGTAIGMMLIYGIILGALSFLGNYIPFVGSIAILVVSVPLSYGFIGQMLKYTRKQEVGFFDFFTLGFNNFGKSWSIVGRTMLKLLPYIIAYVICIVIFTFIAIFALGMAIAGVTSGSELTGVSETIKSAVNGAAIIVPIFAIIFFIVTIVYTMQSYYYVLTELIGNDTTEMSAKEIVERSKELMKGHRWEYFVLQLSFIGWILLANLTFGIGYLWLAPYMEVTMIKFYENLAGNKEVSNVEEVIQENY